MAYRLARSWGQIAKVADERHTGTGHDNGQLGDGGTTPSYKPAAVPLPAGQKARSIPAGERAFAITILDTSRHVVSGKERQMSATWARGRITIGILAAALGAASLSLPGLATASGRPAATTPPTVRGWGINDDFALGNGSLNSDSLTPVKVKLPKGITVTSVRSGCDDGVALTKTGAAVLGRQHLRPARRRHQEGQENPGPRQAAEEHHRDRGPGRLRRHDRADQGRHGAGLGPRRSRPARQRRARRTAASRSRSSCRRAPA